MPINEDTRLLCMCCNQKILYFNRFLANEKSEGRLIIDRTTENVNYVKDLVKTFGGVASFIKCGKCIECKSMKTLEWSLRLLAEYETNKSPCYFLTLTYNDKCLKSKNLVPHDLHKFLDNLQYHGYKFKYFACGEYGGSESHRPHFHLIIWLDKPLTDLVKYDDKLFTSQIIENIWVNKGSVKVGYVDTGSIMYVAGYVDKKITKTIDLDLVPEFQRFSKGIGLDYFNLHYKEMLKDDKVYFNGKAFGLPRYYSKLLKSRFPHIFEKLRLKRFNENFNDFNISNKSDRSLHLSQLQREKLLLEFKKLSSQRDNI